MTRDEAIKYLRQIYPNGGHCWLDNQRIEALQMAIDALLQLSLPEGLDEAAQKAGLEYTPIQEGEAIDCNGDVYATDDVEWPSRCGFIIGFKEGVKWQAGQGEIHELRVESPLLGPPMICCPVKAKNGDTVIVQIRRVNEKGE